MLDADEFYIDDPRKFLADVDATHDEVWSASFEYYFTDRDLERYEADPAAYGDSVPVRQKLRFYVNNWSEPRFFRHSTRLIWTRGAWPENLASPHPERIRLRHFQYRSPAQMQKRLETRREPMLRGHFAHEGLPEWRSAMFDVRSADFATSSPEHAPRDWTERVVAASALLEDAPGTEYIVDEAALPPIPRARPGWRRWLGRLRRHVRRRVE
jgi:hypothetical protein